MNKLIGSAPSLELLLNEIKKRWYWSEVPLIQVSSNEWTVNDSLRIKHIKGRFRLEMIIKE